MSRMETADLLSFLSPPRVSGDEPLVTGNATKAARSAPRKRG